MTNQYVDLRTVTAIGESRQDRLCDLLEFSRGFFCVLVTQLKR